MITIAATMGFLLLMCHVLALLASVLVFITYPNMLANSREWQSKWFWIRCILVALIAYAVVFLLSMLIFKLGGIIIS